MPAVWFARWWIIGPCYGMVDADWSIARTHGATFMSTNAVSALMHWHQQYGVDDVLLPNPRNFTTPQAKAPETEKQTVATPAAINFEQAADLADLARMMEELPFPLKQAGVNFVFADGNPAARLMVVGEAPGEEENRLKRPFVGQAGQLLDKMLTAIGISRTNEDPRTSAYITNIIPWRPPANRKPTEEECLIFKPAMLRHGALIAPKLILAMGGTPSNLLLGDKTGITRLRGRCQDVAFGDQKIKVLATLHPAYLLRNPLAKREAWADLKQAKMILEQED